MMTVASSSQRSVVVAAVAALALLAGCGSRSELLLSDEPPAFAGAAGPAGDQAAVDGGQDPVRRVLLLTVDGLGSAYLEQPLAEHRIPNLARLQQRGASTLNARTDYTHPFTLPGHVSILTGRPVLEVQGLPATTHHGYVGNFDPAADETLHNAGNPALDYVASVFDVVHDHGLRTCLYAGKTKFSLFSQSYDAEHGAPDRVGSDDGRDKIDRFLTINHDSTALVSVAAGELASDQCDFALVHLTELDQDGHTIGWGSPEWMALLERVDGWVGELWAAVEANGDRAESWAMIVTSDHGGDGLTHFDPAVPSTYQIPFYVVAPPVPGGADLYALAGATRADPAGGAPSYAEPGQPIRNGDAANVALALMCLPPVDGSLMRDLALRR